jgi:hypothetical protein
VNTFSASCELQQLLVGGSHPETERDKTFQESRSMANYEAVVYCDTAALLCGGPVLHIVDDPDGEDDEVGKVLKNLHQNGCPDAAIS